MSDVARGEPSPRVLFVQHAGALGGSAYSLLFTMEGLRLQGFSPEVALLHPNQEMRSFYEEAGFPVYAAPGISIFSHTTGGYASWRSLASLRQMFRQICHWRAARLATLKLVRSLNPDLVHLNSVVLLPSAQALRKAGIPHVWHVRESPPGQGVRTRFIGRELARHPSLIFISAYDREMWIRGTHGVVIPNFIDEERYERAPSREEARRALGLPADSPVLLYLGGTQRIKGFPVLIEALPEVTRKFPDTIVAMPGAEIRPSSSRTARLARFVLPFLGWGTAGQRLQKRISNLHLAGTVRMLPFAKDVVPWLAACDVLVFPSTAPHFARPVIEAASMGRPSVGSDIGGVRELIDSDITGVLVPPGDVIALAAALTKLFADSTLRAILGEAGRERACRLYARRRNIRSVILEYRRFLPAS